MHSCPSSRGENLRRASSDGPRSQSVSPGGPQWNMGPFEKTGGEREHSRPPARCRRRRRRPPAAAASHQGGRPLPPPPPLTGK